MKKLLLPLLLATLCSCNPTVNSSSSSTDRQLNESTAKSSSTTNNNSSNSFLSSTTSYLQLDEVKNNAIVTLTNEFNKYDIDDYSIQNWNKMIDILTKAEYDIYNATDEAGVSFILEKAINDLAVVETYAEEKQNEKTVIELNEAISIGTAYKYSLSNVQNLEKVMRVKVILDIDFNGADQNHIYWGGNITIGSSIQEIAGAGYEEKIDEDGNDVPEATRQIINIDAQNLTSSDSVNVFVTYAGGNFDIKVASISFYYNNDYELKQEKIEINQSIHNNKTVNLAYNELKNKGDVYKIELNLTITGNQSYTGGSVFVKGCTFTSANTINIGNIMIPNETSIGSVYIYPEEKIDLSIAEEFSFTSWWAPASEIILNYVIVYTKN